LLSSFHSDSSLHIPIFK